VELGEDSVQMQTSVWTLRI